MSFYHQSFQYLLPLSVAFDQGKHLIVDVPSDIGSRQTPLGKAQDGVILRPGLFCPELLQSALVYLALQQQFFIFV